MVNINIISNIVKRGTSLSEIPLGTLYSSSSFSSLNDFTTNGITAAINGSAIELDTDTLPLTRTLDYNRISALEDWTISCRFTAQAGNGGGFVGKRSRSTFSKANLYASWANGQLSIQTGVDGSMVTQGATVACAGSAGNTIELTLQKVGPVITATARNITTDGPLATKNYTYIIYDIITPLMPNTGRYCLGAYENNLLVTSFTISSTVKKNARLCFIVDSIGEAYCASVYENIYRNFVNDFYPTTISCGAQSDSTVEALSLMPELTELNSDAYVVAVGANDVGYGVSSATYITNYDSIVSQLVALGKRVIHMPYYITAVSMAPLTNHITSTYSSDDIIDITLGMTSADLLPDGVHLNGPGNIRQAKNIINSGKLGTEAVINTSSVNTSIVSYWKFDANANDSVGSNNGTVTGASLVSGIISNGYSFNGSQYITINDAANLSFGNGTVDSPFSWSMWINPTNFSAQRFIINKRATETTQGEYDILVSTDAKVEVILFSQLGVSVYVYRRSGLTLDVAKWNHVVITYDGTGYNGIKIYINNVLSTGDIDASSGSYVAMNNGTGNLLIASRYEAGLDGFIGTIDELGLWSRELTVSEIRNIFNVSRAKTYPF